MHVLFDIFWTVGTLLLVAIGLQLILGLMKIVNLAHTGLMAVAVYVSVTMTANGLPFWTAVAAAVAAAALAGAIIERLVLRRIYGSSIDDSILAMWAVSLCLVHVITLVYGRGTTSLPMPIDGGITILGMVLPAYRILVLVLAFLTVAVLYACMRFTKAGLRVRMVMSNESLATGLGVDAAAVRRATFVTGAAFAGFAGALLGPTQGITPNYGAYWLPTSMMAVLMAGPSLPGLVASSALLGASHAILSYLTNPVMATTLTIFVAVVVLRTRGRGAM